MITYEEITSMNTADLMQKALSLKLERRGTKMGLCTISNARCGGCSEDCSFCAQSSISKTEIDTFPLKDKYTLLKEAEEAQKIGAARFSIVISGRGPDISLTEHIAEIIHEIREKIGISTCASLGIMDKQGLSILKGAGLTRYHHNLETSRDYFPHICSTHSFEDRVATIKYAKEAGLEVCAGGIIGLGEDERQRYSMAITLAELDVHSCPVNILVPIQGTPLVNIEPISITEILRAVAIFRLLLPDCAIRIAGGRENMLGDFQALAFMSGADAMLIGGYLTTRGRSPEIDLEFTRKMREIWSNILHQ